MAEVSSETSGRKPLKRVVVGAGKSRTDEELVELARAGDRSAMNTLLEQNYDRIYRVCRRLAGNDADAADATQEALMAVVRGLSKFDGRSKFSTWSYRVATNACLDELRRRGRRPTPVDTETSPAPEAVSGHDDQVADRLDIDRALPQIPEEYRAPVVLRDVVGMDYAEIAHTLGIPPGTVRSRIARGRKALAVKLRTDPGTSSSPENVTPDTDD